MQYTLSWAKTVVKRFTDQHARAPYYWGKLLHITALDAAFFLAEGGEAWHQLVTWTKDIESTGVPRKIDPRALGALHRALADRRALGPAGQLELEFTTHTCSIDEQAN